MTFSLLEHSDTSTSFIGYDTQPNSKKSNLIAHMGLASTGHYYLDHHLLGKNLFDNQSLKAIRSKRELCNLGRKDIIDSYEKSLTNCIKKYNDLPHALEIKNKTNIKSVKRFCQKIPIFQDSFGG